MIIDLRPLHERLARLIEGLVLSFHEMDITCDVGSHKLLMASPAVP
jgi:hypothetical protein